MAMSSVRVMATCSLLGQAVGTAAAIAHKYGLQPHGVYLSHMEELQDRLLAADCYLPGKARKISPLCIQTPLENGHNALKDGRDRPISHDPHDVCGHIIPNRIPLVYRFENPQKISSVHVVFDSDLNRNTLPGDACEREHTMRCNIRLDSPQTFVPLTLCKSFVLEAETSEGIIEIFRCEKNLKRAHHFILEREVTALRLISLENWGNTSETRIFSFDFL